jgi:hypothetical protein
MRMDRSRGTRRTGDSLPALLAECARRPGAIIEIGAGGIGSPRALRQLALAFLGLAAADGLLWGAIDNGLHVAALAAAPVSLLGECIRLLILALGFYVVAQVSRPQTRFWDLAVGLAFIHVVGALLFLVLGLAVVGLALVLVRADSVAAAAELLVVALSLVALAVWLPLYTAFAMGAFDAGCLGSGFLGFVAFVVTIVTESALAAAFAGG